ncbi:hypothetical protein [Bacillus sp. V2I10]|uniref:hypothetical protein n=1 Tax=Bacillus sp. V2I10 TaxID=3042276 RepID=UPI00207A3CDC|nr:hypothetical protein [Bacillus sp. V2I10]MDQ0860598.1 recombinational DNA repair protein RecR [Bacillus sp. V2I10]USK35290.1 hypothetical protein LIT25_08350 [Bacillus sp. F19]
MKNIHKIFILCLFSLFLSACKDEDEGRDRRLVVVEDMLEAILEEDKRDMRGIYLEGAYHSPQELISLKKKWKIENLELEDFEIKEESFYVFRAYYDQDDQKESKAIAFRVRETDEDELIVDYVDQVVEEKKNQ